MRFQIEAIRDILGNSFRMTDYPAQLHKPHLVVWSSQDRCVIARRHEQGGYQTMSEAEIKLVVEDVRLLPIIVFRMTGIEYSHSRESQPATSLYS